MNAKQGSWDDVKMLSVIMFNSAAVSDVQRAAALITFNKSTDRRL